MKRDEAKAIIEAIVAMRDATTDEQALATPILYPAWRSGVEYAAGKRVLHDGMLYKVNEGMGHTSQTGWEPNVAPSLFACVLTSDDGTPLEWVQPSSTNPYMTGDKVIHNESTWVSLIDNNVWEPTESNATLWKRI